MTTLPAEVSVSWRPHVLFPQAICNRCQDRTVVGAGMRSQVLRVRSGVQARPTNLKIAVDLSQSRLLLQAS